MRLQHYFLIKKSLLYLALFLLFIFIVAPIFRIIITAKNNKEFITESKFSEIGLYKTKYYGYDDELNPFYIESKKAVNRSNNIILLEDLESSLRADSHIRVKAKFGQLKQDEKFLILRDEVTVISEDQYNILTNYAEINLNNYDIQGDQEIKFHNKFGDITSTGFFLNSNESKFIFSNNALLELEDKQKYTKITAETITIFNKDNIALFSDNAVATGEEFVLKGNNFKVLFSDIKKDITNVDKIFAEENIEFIRLNEKAWSDSAKYDAKTQKVFLIGNVKVKKDNDISYGDKLIYDLQTDISHLVSGEKKRVNIEIDQEI